MSDETDSPCGETLDDLDDVSNAKETEADFDAEEVSE